MTTNLFFFWHSFAATEDVIPPEPEAPESIDYLDDDIVLARRRINWRRGKMLPVKSVYPNE